MRERDHLGDPGVDGMLILKWILKKWNRGLSWLRIGVRGRMV
jgi:hypothetical protein